VSLTLSLSALEKSSLTCGDSLFQNGYFAQIRACFQRDFQLKQAIGNPDIWSGFFEYHSFLNSGNRKAAGKPPKSLYSSLNSKVYFSSFRTA
jgi:hypothetical protein